MVGGVHQQADHQVLPSVGVAHRGECRGQLPHQRLASVLDHRGIVERQWATWMGVLSSEHAMVAGLGQLVDPVGDQAESSDAEQPGAEQLLRDLSKGAAETLGLLGVEWQADDESWKTRTPRIVMYICVYVM